MKLYRGIGLSRYCLVVILVVIELCSTSSLLFFHSSQLFDKQLYALQCAFFDALLALAKVKHELQMRLKSSFILFSYRVLQLLIAFDVTIGGLINYRERKAPRILTRSNAELQGKYLETGNLFKKNFFTIAFYTVNYFISIYVVISLNFSLKLF